MARIKISKSKYPKLVEFMLKCYPEYNGRKFYVEACDHEFETHSYWSGGSKEEFCFIKTNGSILQVPSHTHPYTQHCKENRKAKLVPGLACVVHTYFCGQDLGLKIMLHPNDFPKLIEHKN